MQAGATQQSPPAPLGAVLLVTALCSLGTGVFWNGLSFIAFHGYGFSRRDNLLLYAVMGAVYIIGAFRAGWLTRRAERWLSTRGVLAAAVSLQAVLCLGPVAFQGPWTVWVAGGLVTFLYAIIWPVLESYLTAGRHGASMRSAVGWFNLTWAPFVAIPLLAMGPILEEHARWAIGGMAPVNLLALLTLSMFDRRPGHHDPEQASAHVTAEYPLLLASARALLPASYVLISAMNPILPYRFGELDVVAVEWETPATATWTVLRFITFVALWRRAFWHGRWGTLLLGGIAMTGGFALVVAGPTLALMLVGFGVLGVGLGVIYYAALYYAMAVGRAAVDAGGTHEGLIGVGYAGGPLAGLAGSAARQGALGVVAVVWGLLGIAAAAALRPYLAARRLRQKVDIRRE